MNIIIPTGQTRTLQFVAKPGNTVLEIAQEPNSLLSLVYLQSLPLAEEAMTTICITLQKNARLKSFVGMFGSASSSLMIETNLRGEGASVYERTLYFGNNEQSFTMSSNTTIFSQRATAKIESKGILTDRAHARFDGNIHLTQTAKESSADLIEHTLLLSSEARMNAIPGLKIDTNNVSATHSASMTRIDDEQLFYCKSRGIEERDAIRLIAEGFLSSMLIDNSLVATFIPLIKEKICRLQ